MISRKIAKFVFSVVLCAGITETAGATVPRGDVNLIVVSDLGRNGHYDQKKVSETLGQVAEEIGPEAVLALGDTHHYGGVNSVSDPLWMTNFELIYSHPELMVNWYPILGNHEYRGDSQAVIDYSDISRRWEMPARYYSKSFDGDNTTVKVVFIDTTPLIDKYRSKADTYPDVAAQDMGEELKWLDDTLTSAEEDWVIVVGHHPIYASTDKPESERTDMQKRIDTILRKHNVDMYICGHLHNFQHLRHPDSDIDYIVNTSGSKSREPGKTDDTVFASDVSGFSVLTADKKTLKLYMLDKNGETINVVSRSGK